MAQQPRKNTVVGNPAKKDAKQEFTATLGFRCALTGKIMTDPYIATNGISYEKRAIEAELRDHPDSVLSKMFAEGFFPNRFLKQTIEIYNKQQQTFERLQELSITTPKEVERQQREIAHLTRLATSAIQKMSGKKSNRKEKEWREIKPTTDAKVSDQLRREGVEIANDAEIVLKNFECPIDIGEMDAPMFCTTDQHNYNNTVNEQELEKVLHEDARSPITQKPLKGRLLIPNENFRQAIAAYPRQHEQTLTEKYAESLPLRIKQAENASLIEQMRAFLTKENIAITPLPVLQVAGTPREPNQSPYLPAGSIGPGPSVLYPAAAGVSVSASPSLRTTGAEPSSYRPAEKPNWKEALDTADGNDFAKLIETADSKALKTEIDGLSLVEYLALHSPWPPLPGVSNKHLPNKKALLHKLSAKGITLAPLLKAATLGDYVAVKALMGKKQKPALCDSADHHFLHYVVLNNFYNRQEPSPYKVLLAEWGKQFADKIAAGERLLAQQPEFLKDPTEHLFQAIEKGNRATVKSLLDAKISPNIKRSDGLTTPLLLATKLNHKDILTILVEAKATSEPFQNKLVDRARLDSLMDKEFASTMPANENLLFQAAIEGNQATIRQLLEAKVSPNTFSGYGHTPLHVAAQYGHADLVALLLDRKAEINALIKDTGPSLKGATPLFIAAMLGNTEVVKLLIKKKANMEIAPKEKKLTALTVAIANNKNSYETAGVLINAKADLEAKLDGKHTPLYIAAVEKQGALVNKLLAARANPDISTPQGKTLLESIADMNETDAQYDPIMSLLLLATGNSQKYETTHFFQAIKKGDQATVKRLLDAKVSSDVVNKDGYTPLHIAAKHGHPEVAALLLDRKADINALSKDAESHQTPLFVAVMAGNQEMVKLLITKKADMEIADSKTKSTPLIAALIATKKNSYNIASALIDAKADLEAKATEYTPLYIAALYKQVAVVKKLLTARANPNISIQGVPLPLEDILSESDPQHKLVIDLLRAQESEAERFFQAIQTGDESTVKRLLDAKTNPHLRLPNENTPLVTAVLHDQIGILQMLVDAKADPNNCIQGKISLLYILAASEGDRFAMVDILVRAKADVNAAHNNQVVQQALIKNHTQIAQRLLDAKAIVTTTIEKMLRTYKDGTTPLHAVVAQNDPALVTELLEANAPIEATNAQGLTPLSLAVLRGFTDIAQLLITKRANINTSNDGATPLLLAVCDSNLAMVELLIAAKANPNGTPPLFPLVMATARQNPLIIKALVEAKADVESSVMVTMALEADMVDEQEQTTDYLRRKKPEEKVALQQTTEPPTLAADQKASTTVSPLSAVLQSQSRLDLSLAGLAEIEASRQATERLRQPKSQAMLAAQSLTGVLRSDPSSVPSEPRSDNPPPDGLQPARAALS